MALSLAVLTGLTGCASVEHSTPAGADLSRIRRVAVLPFTPPGGVSRESAPGISEGVADLAAAQLIRHGWQVVERARVQEILRERNLNLAEMPTGKNLEDVRTILGVDAFATGAITEWREDVVMRNVAAVGITLKLYDAQTGEIAYMGSASDTLPPSIFTRKTPTNLAQELLRKLCDGIPRR